MARLPKRVLTAAAFVASFNVAAEIPVQFTQCLLNVPPLIEPGDNALDEKVTIYSERSSATFENDAVFEGDVYVTQGNKKLNADRTVYSQQTNRLNGYGNVFFTDGLISLEGDEFEAHTDTDYAKVIPARYQIHGDTGNGTAEVLEVFEKSDIKATTARFTGCPPGDKSWHLRATTLDIDNEKQMATAYNARVHVADVPIFYTPYLSYPIGDQRMSGFLFPTFATNTKNGFDLRTPYYLNLAPNYDATLTPRFMTNRGLAVESDFRYLFGKNRGTVYLDYLNNDKLVDDSRYLLAIRHGANLTPSWNYNVNYTSVSDNNYFTDLGDRNGFDDGNRLLQKISTSYTSSNWKSDLIVQDMQVLGNSSKDAPFIIQPQLKLYGDWELPLGNVPSLLSLESEIINYSHDDETRYRTKRVHIEPTLTFPYVLPSGYVSSSIALMQTTYDQDIRDATNSSGQALVNLEDGIINRTLPKLSIDAGLNYERPTAAFGNAYTQTLEPRIKYLYIPYQYQENIGLYDTSTMQQDYFGLFRDHQYSGYDRIADANQFTLGATSRYLNQGGSEKLRLALGQIFFLQQSQVVEDWNNANPNSQLGNSSTSVLAFEADANIKYDWSAHFGLQVDPDAFDVNKTNSALEWRPASNRYIQLNHRFISAEESLRVNQIGTHFAWPLKENISLRGSYNYDTNQGRNVDSFVSLRFDACCWAIELSYVNTLLTSYNSDNSNQGEMDKSLQFKFEIKGLGGSNSLSSPSESQKIKYGQPFYLND
ncbi:LPS-assembly protein LptD [Alginatibacterium sediminis]|uniref:LPS-assembly protein LptD n=1 Tax=Alginatibacterium sediminis TaxID=2164068 RepID=A0A420E7P6_9ALTE|nr:LPS assembly protein LptD [Alginatibacterium sediminis]RKF14542.1 LPS-assembly protein LptD [Alginatibacterium sediminis]